MKPDVSKTFAAAGMAAILLAACGGAVSVSPSTSVAPASLAASSAPAKPSVPSTSPSVSSLAASIAPSASSAPDTSLAPSAAAGASPSVAAVPSSPPPAAAPGSAAPVSAPPSSPAAKPAPSSPPAAPAAPAPRQAGATISNFAFVPASITVPRGSTVTWSNKDAVAHTVTGSSGGFASGAMATGKAFSFTFNTPGTFGYICSIHTYMAGTVVVQ